MKYVPILKWKQGEQNAIKNLESSIKQNISPVIELVRIPKGRTKTPTVEEYITENINSIEKVFSETDIFFIDLYDFDEKACLDDGTHFMKYLYDSLAKNNIKPVPVIRSSRSDIYKKTIKNICKQHNTGLCLRLFEADFLNIEATINEVIKYYEVEKAGVSIIIDLKQITSGDINSKVLAAYSIINSIHKIGPFSRVILCGTGFPSSLASIKRNTIEKIQRDEWVIWTSIYNARAQLPFIPEYGDYNITNPDMIDFDPVKMHVGGKIKYTFENDFIIFKGSSIKRNGSGQMYQLALKIVKAPCFMGEKYSWGDKYIYNCSKLTATCGNPTTWVTVGVNHHITYVIDQLSKMSVL